MVHGQAEAVVIDIVCFGIYKTKKRFTNKTKLVNYRTVLSISCSVLLGPSMLDSGLADALLVMGSM